MLAVCVQRSRRGGRGHKDDVELIDLILRIGQRDKVAGEKSRKKRGNTSVRELGGWFGGRLHVEGFPRDRAEDSVLVSGVHESGLADASHSRAHRARFDRSS